MTVKQLSVFVENKPGRLAEFTDLLRKHGIDMRALSIAEANDFGILRIIVDDSYATACLLKEEGYVFSITPVVAVAIPDEAGGLCEILHILQKNNINLEYTYAFISRKKDLAYMILRVQDEDCGRTVEVLNEAGVTLIGQDDLTEF